MQDYDGMGRLLMAETLGLAMARRAADILDRHRDALASAVLGQVSNNDRCRDDPGRGDPGQGEPGPDSLEGGQLALDDAIFTAVLDAANECLGRFDSRPASDRWCDALLYLLDLARYAAEAK